MAGLINLRLLTDFFNKIDPTRTLSRYQSSTRAALLTLSFCIAH